MVNASNATPRSRQQISVFITLAVFVSCIWSLLATKYGCGEGIIVLAFSPPSTSATVRIIPGFRSLARRSSSALRMTSVNSTTATMSRDSKTQSSSTVAPTLLQRRLFERHKVPLSDAVVIQDSYYSEEKKEELECYGSATDVVVEVKTLVWEVQGIITGDYKDGNLPTKFPETFYVVSALQMKDKIEMRKLKDLVLEKTNRQRGTLTTIKSMQLAPLKIAENLTGFQSGCMPPICHKDRDMDLYVDKSISDIYKTHSSTNTANTFASIGSGIPGKSLVMPLNQFLRVAGVDFGGTSFDNTVDASTTEETHNGGSGFVGSIISPNSPIENAIEGGKSDSTEANDQAKSKTNNDGTHPTSNEIKMMSGMEIRRLKQEERKQQREARKDRLKEYRRFKKDDILSKAKLFRTTARKKGRIPEMEELIQEALAVGDFPKLMEIPDEQNPNTNIDKNALHICAWRGDFETVVRLIEISNERFPELDVVNMISKGPGNYGKTPIFYALTQCREDVVRYLVEEAGADLLIVNNKGQTPCSIARSHVCEETCKLLYETEAKQLATRSLTIKSGEELFANHRAGIHNDHKLYGDLDPRFPIDDDNRYFNDASRKSEEEKLERRKKSNTNTGYDPQVFHENYMNRTDDLTNQIKEFEESVRQAPEESKIMGIPTQFSPRSFRPTVRWWNRDDRSLAKANDDTSLSGQVTFTQSRSKPKKEDHVSKKERKEEKSNGSGDSTAARFHEVDIDSLDLISLNDVMDQSSDHEDSCSQQNKVLVDKAESLRLFEAEVDSWISELSQDLDNGVDNDQSILLKYAWGIDCEWKPGPDCGEDSPVATLQLGTSRKVFLVDLQTLCRSQDGFDQDRSLEKDLDKILLKLFRNRNISLVGYGVLQDLGKLAASFPHLQCFSEFVSVVDLQSISSVVYNRKFERKAMSSLQKMTAMLLNKRLDKTEQVSDWSHRPLSENQISYAMLDAAIIPLLLRAIFDSNAVIEGYQGSFFKVHKNLIFTVRYLPVKACEDGYAYQISHGSIKSNLGKAFARQSWPTKMKADPPGPPQLIKIQEIPNDDLATKRISKKERAHLRKIGADEFGNVPKRPKAIPLKTLSGNLDNLPRPGISLGFTKESCAFRVVGHELFKTIPEGTYIGFNRRSGVAETSNAWILFCNFGGEKVFSEFSDSGRKLCFRVNSSSQMGRSSEACLYREMVSSSLNEEKKPIFLFARESTRSKYLYCGQCSCSDVSNLDEDTAALELQLKDYDELTNEKLRISSDFAELVTKSLR